MMPTRCPMPTRCQPILVLLLGQFAMIANAGDVWTTTADRRVLLQHQQFEKSDGLKPGESTIEVDPRITYQTIEGFGFTLTGGSARLIHQLSDERRSVLLRELFGRDAGSIGVSFVRISVGASDLDDHVFSYLDLAAGQVDPELKLFDLAPDEQHLIPVLQEILRIQPKLGLMATPWSPPTWMKSNGHSIGGALRPEYYATYGNYLVRYIQEMKKRGIEISALSLQNEPANGENNPSMRMSAQEQSVLIRDHLGPALEKAGISTRILIWDHNCDQPEYPLEILADARAKRYVFGTAFHLYAGSPAALGQVQRAHPDKAIWFTEQWTEGGGNFGGDLMWHIEHVMIETIRNGSSVVLEWNLASDPKFEPHTPGGCTRCLGGLTIDQDMIDRNVSYYVIAHVAQFVPPGSRRIESSAVEHLPNVAFLTPSGKLVLMVLNRASDSVSFSIQANGHPYRVSLPSRSVATYVWE